jgi:ERCC4-type nuclease
VSIWNRSWYEGGAPRIIIDTREQTPWTFPAGHPTVRAKLEYGDYSLEGYQHQFAIERKSLADYVGSITQGRERFMREIEGGTCSLEYFCIIVEGSYADLANGTYGTNANPWALMQTSNSIEVKRCVSVHFEGSGYNPNVMDRATWAMNNRAIAQRRAYDLLRWCWKTFKDEG